MAETEFFDRNYYLKFVPEGEWAHRSDWRHHYLTRGWLLGLDPHPGFSTNGYLVDNPDVRDAGVNPLEHFELSGRAEGRHPVAVSDYERRDARRQLVRPEEWFDLEFYRLQVDGDLFASAADGLNHYLETGWRLGFDPHPAFSTNGYLHDNPDVRRDGMDPLTHFVRHGFAEDRSPVNPLAFASPTYRTPDQPWMANLRNSLAQYLQHLGVHADLVDMDLTDEGLMASDGPEWFDGEHYLMTYTDVAKAEAPALWHFVVSGHREGRFPNREVAEQVALRADLERVLLSRSVDHDAEDAAQESVQRVRSGDEVAREILVEMDGTFNRVVIALSHDDYREHVGGVQLVCAREEEEFRAIGDLYLSVFPSRTRSFLSPESPDDALVSCRVNGRRIEGTVRLVELGTALAAAHPNLEVIVVVHSLLGQSPEAIDSLINDFRSPQLAWWIHDYSAHCENYRLTRNGVTWCGDPDPSSQSCTMCSFGGGRKRHLHRVRALMDRHSWLIAAPSETAAKVSTSGNTPLAGNITVFAHGEIRSTGRTRTPVHVEKPLRVAFVGHPAMIKGWNRFMAFVSDIGPFAPEFEFLHLGVEDRRVPNVRFIGARPGPGGHSPVTDLLILHDVDAIMNFVDGKETFNFVTYEAIAAGCCVITSPRSGNVVEAAHDSGLLVEVTDETQTFDYAAIGDQIREMRGSEVGEFVFTGLTRELLARGLP